MSHDHGQPKEKTTSIISFKNSFWLVVIIVGLFIAALNFIQAEGGGEGQARSKVESAAAPADEKSAGEIRAEVKGEAPQPSATPAPAASATDSAQAK